MTDGEPAVMDDYGLPYGQPYGPPVLPPRTNGMAIAALACGVVGIFLFPAAALAIAFGHVARRDIRQSGEGGRRAATAGLILGYGVLVAGIVIIAWFYFILYLAAHIPDPQYIPAPSGTAGGG